MQHFRRLESWALWIGFVFPFTHHPHITFQLFRLLANKNKMIFTDWLPSFHDYAMELVKYEYVQVKPI